MNVDNIIKSPARAMTICLLLLSGCATTSGLHEDRRPPISKPKISEAKKKSSQTPEGRQESQGAEYFGGEGPLYAVPKDKINVSKTSSGDFNVSFVGADIKLVVDAVLKEMMGYNYVIDPNIRGTISIETAGASDKRAVFDALESVLGLKSIALVPVDGVYQVVPKSKAPKLFTGFQGEIPSSHNLPGFGVQIVPLKYTSPSEMQKILRPFAPNGAILQVNEERRLLVLAGTGREIASMQNIIRTFDQDMMKGMNFVLFTLKHVDAETIAKEVKNIIGDADTSAAGAVKLIPIPRINKLLGIAAHKESLAKVANWVEKLDKIGGTSGKRIYVYHVKNGRAADLASSLSKIFGAQSGGDFNSGSSSFNQRAGAGSSSDNRQQGFADRGRGLNSTGGSGSASGFETQNLRVVPNETNNSLLIYAGASDFSMIEDALSQLDLPPRQVLIEAALAEITLTDELRYGVQWFKDYGSKSLTFSTTGSQSPSSIFPGFSYAYANSSGFQAVLNALEGITDVNVISHPKLLVLNNQPATLQVGDEVPVLSASAQSVSNDGAPIVNSISYKSTGVIMSVTPRINEGGLVILDVKQQISEAVTTTSSGIDAPTIQKREIESTIAAQDGQTIALGGLIRETQSRTKSGVPYVSRIPLLGRAFSNNSLETRRTELIILLTPRVIRNSQETNEVMDYLRGEFRNILPKK